MKIFVVTYEYGEYEQREFEVIGVFDSLDKAVDIVTSVGFEGGRFDDYYNHFFFIRQHGNVAGKSVEHMDWAFIKEYELGVIQDEYGVFTTHYK